MSVRKYKSNPVELLEEGKKIMSHSDGSKFYRKVAAVNHVLSGTSAANVATANGLCRATVSGWVKKVDEQGFDALWEMPRKGRISKLSHEQYCELDSIILNTSTTIESLRSFLATCPPQEGKKYAIVMDNASWHKAAKKAIGSERLRHPAFYDISNYVVFIDMPPYSPDLNPIEQVWRVTRREFTHNRFFKSIIVLEGTTDRAFAEWAKPNAQLQSLCGFM